jgi:hypothetical protein
VFFTDLELYGQTLYINITVIILDITHRSISRIVTAAYVVSSPLTKSFWCGKHFDKFITVLFILVIGSLWLLSSLLFIMAASFGGIAVVLIAAHSSSILSKVK